MASRAAKFDSLESPPAVRWAPRLANEGAPPPAARGGGGGGGGGGGDGNWGWGGAATSSSPDTMGSPFRCACMGGFAEMEDAVGAVGGGGAAGAPSRGAMMDFGVYHPANHDGWHGDGGRLDMHCTGAARRQFPATPMAGGGACGGAAAEEEGRRDEAMARLERLQQRAESPSHLQSSPCSSTLAIPAISHQHVNLAQLHEGTATCTATSPSRGAPSSRGAARGAGGGARGF